MTRGGTVYPVVYVKIVRTLDGWPKDKNLYIGADHPIRGNEFWIEHYRVSARYLWEDFGIVWDESLGPGAREKFMNLRNSWIRDYPHRKKEINDAFDEFWSYFLLAQDDISVSNTGKSASQLMAGLLETNDAQMSELLSKYGEPDSLSTSKWGNTIYHYLFPNGEKLLFKSGSKDSRVKEVEWFSEIVKDLDALQEKFKKYLVGQDFKIMNPTAITFQKVVNRRSRSVNVMVQKSFMYLWEEDYYNKGAPPDIIYILIAF